MMFVSEILTDYERGVLYSSVEVVRAGRGDGGYASSSVKSTLNHACPISIVSLRIYQEGILTASTSLHQFSVDALLPFPWPYPHRGTDY